VVVEICFPSAVSAASGSLGLSQSGWPDTPAIISGAKISVFLIIWHFLIKKIIFVKDENYLKVNHIYYGTNS